MAIRVMYKVGTSVKFCLNDELPDMLVEGEIMSIHIAYDGEEDTVYTYYLVSTPKLGMFFVSAGEIVYPLPPIVRVIADV